jgi:hypothetical protein
MRLCKFRLANEGKTPVLVSPLQFSTACEGVGVSAGMRCVRVAGSDAIVWLADTIDEIAAEFHEAINGPIDACGFPVVATREAM